MKRRKKKNAGPVILILLLLVLIAVLSYKFIFVIRYEPVTGTSSISEEDIQRAADLDLGQSIFTVNEDSVRRGINALGEVEFVSAKVQLPSTVIIEVRQRTPAASFTFLNTTYVMDENAYVIRTAPATPDGCIEFTGVNVLSCRIGSQLSADEGQTDAMCTVIAALWASGGTDYVKEVNVDDLDDIKIECVNGTTVSVGDVNNMDRKMAWMTAAVADLTQRGQKGGTLDVSSGTKADYSAPAAEETE